jgi:hypothetical protein
MNGLPDLRLLPDAPVPDGRTVLTEPEALNGCNGSIRGRGGISPPFIPVTNTIEALNRQLRKAIKTKGSFPTEDAARKLVYLALQNAVPQWTRCRDWTTTLLAFKIHFGDRVPDAANYLSLIDTYEVTVTLNYHAAYTVNPKTSDPGRGRSVLRAGIDSVRR